MEIRELQDLRLLLASRYPIIVIETWEEQRALTSLRRLALEQALPMYSWTVTEGLRREELVDAAAQKHNSEPHAVLAHIRSSRQPGLYALLDFHPFLQDDPKVVRLMKEIAHQHESCEQTLVLVSHAASLPPELKRMSITCQLALPDETQLLEIVQEEARRWAKETGQRVRTDRASLDRMVSNLRGATHSDARRLARGAIADDGAITETDLPDVNRAKFGLLDMGGVLSFEYDTARFSDVGGLQNLREWLTKREQAFRGGGGIDTPRGVLLLGVQGGGKSLAAKAVAGMWHLPLLRLDMGAVYNKFFGESERNVREALKLAETMAPCVLWIDEIEKGIASGDNDGGTSRRVLGTLLTWMAERQAPVFMVATANDIAALPPELIRKGRFDEIFFVDLPSPTVREEIFRIHLHRRGLDPDGFELGEVSRLTDGFTGAEIEQVVVAATYSAGAVNESVQTRHLLEELSNTVPLSVTMAEQISALREWCRHRAVPASA